MVVITRLCHSRNEKDIQHASLKAQGHRCFGVGDHSACPWDVNIEYGLAVESPGEGPRAQRCYKPVKFSC